MDGGTVAGPACVGEHSVVHVAGFMVLLSEAAIRGFGCMSSFSGRGCALAHGKTLGCWCTGVAGTMLCCACS